ncbi:MAG: glycoside hydrolase family 15 protein, partial [Candidatus Saccharimonadales bacterium]
GVIYMLGEYYAHSRDREFVQELYSKLIQPAANFMCQFVDEQTGLPHASYDLWEEKFLTTSYTSSLVVQALLVAADFAETFDYPDDDVRWREAASHVEGRLGTFFKNEVGYLAKGFLLKPGGELEFDNTLDASSAYAGMLYMDDKQFSNEIGQTFSSIEQQMLENQSGGCPRYPGDNYFRQADQSNPWFITTLWLAQNYLRQGDDGKTRHYLEWAIDHAQPSGVLSEQIHPDTGEALSVMPLVWSHADFINTVLDLAKVS